MDYSEKIQISAPVRDRADHLPEYLESLRKVSYPKELIEFYFLLNDSSDESQNILEDFQSKYGQDYACIEIESLDLGTPVDKRQGDIRNKVYHSLAKLRNKILERFENSKCSYLFSVDSDIYVKPQILCRLLNHRKDFVAAMISNLPGGKVCPNAMVKQGTGYSRFRPDREEPHLYPVEVSGAVCLMSRNVLSSKYAWSRYGEDIPFCESLLERGIKLYIDTADLARHDMR